MSSALDLVVLNGPLEGEVVQLRPNEPLLLGRSARGLQLIDPLVSLQHAEITWQGDRYWCEDLESATGTFVNDVRLTDKAVVLVPGMRIRLGETDLEVRERPRSVMLRVVGVAAALLIVFLGVRSFMESIEVHYDPRLAWYEPIKQGAGYESEILEIPYAFIREAGVDHRELGIERATDFDENGVDELWLRWPRGRRIVTFTPDGSWRTIAELRGDCREEARTLPPGLPAECYANSASLQSELPDQCRGFDQTDGFPDLDCGGTTLRYIDGEYRIVEHEGLFAWMPPTKVIPAPPAAGRRSRRAPPPRDQRVIVEGPLEPYLFTLVRENRLSGFLAERGIVDPIHYLVCEESLPDVRAQVLTERGEILPLAVGCIGDIELEGPTKDQDFGPGLPKIFAFTGTGYRALVDDVAIYLSGGTDRLFMGRNELALYNAFSSTPQRRVGAIRASFEGPERIFDPIAREIPVPDRGRLQPTEFSRDLPPLAGTVIIDGPGRVELPGCAEIDVQTSAWHCLFTKGCTQSSAFLRMHNVGCGPAPPITIPYAKGVHRYADGHIDGRVAVESIAQDGQIDVVRIRFAHRPAPPKP